MVGKTLEELLEAALRKMVNANAALSKVVGGKVLYEHSPTHFSPSYLAWTDLNDAIAEAKVALLACQIKRSPDVDDSAGRPIG